MEGRSSYANYLRWVWAVLGSAGTDINEYLPPRRQAWPRVVRRDYYGIDDFRIISANPLAERV